MTAKEALENTRKLLKQFFAEEPAGEEPKTESGKLKDGTAIQYTKLEAGGNLFVLDADGAPQPAAAGEYEMEDGVILVVADPGIIAEVKPAPAAEDPQKEEMAAEEPAAEAPKAGEGVDWSEEIKWIKSSLASVAKQVATLSSAMQMFQKATGETIESMLEVVEATASEGKEEPIKKPRQTVFSDQSDKKTRAFEKMQAGAKAYSEQMKKAQ